MKLVVDNTDRIVLNEGDEKISLKQTLIVGKSGHGKSLCLERGIYNYWKNGFNIICINDAKDLLESAFMGFPAEIIADYHKKALQEQNIEPLTPDIIIFHPFSFKTPKTRIPQISLFTFPILAIRDSEIGFLLEDSEDRTTREILLSALNNIKEDDSLWDFLLKVEIMIERQIKEFGIQRGKIPDPKSFGLSGTSMGSLKNIDEILRSFNRFQLNMFLMPENFELNLDIEELFENPEKIKIFTTRYIDDQKTKDFVVLMLLNQIVKNAYKSKHPILIVMDELKDLCPSNTNLGYKKILAKEISRMLNTMFRANNIASISTSQSFSGISKYLLRTNCFTEVFIGSLDSETDLLNLKQIYNFDKPIINSIQNLDFNCFLIRGIPDLPINAQEDNPFRSLFSPFPHKEPYYKFDDLFEKYYPEKMNKYSEILNKMESLKEKFINKNMDFKLSKIKQEEEQNIKQQKEKDEIKELKDKVEKLNLEKKQSKAEQIKQRNDEIWNLRNELTQEELALKFNISQPMVNEILKKKTNEGF